MSTVRVESVLEADADDVWSVMQRPDTVRYVLRPWIWLPAVNGRSDLAREGASLTGWMFLLYVIPLGKYTITVADVDPMNRTVRTREHGGVVRSWQHMLQAEPLEPGRCRYTDTVLIDAGLFTPVVTAFARALFRYRHWRWWRLVRRGDLGSAAKG